MGKGHEYVSQKTDRQKEREGRKAESDREANKDMERR